MKNKKIINRLISLFCLYLFFVTFSNAQKRKEICLPDIPGYFTLKCDFHVHTVFSDGEVWPPIRVLEAWQEGLDCIALSDHIEQYHNHKDIIFNNNKPYELAIPYAMKYDMILIKGAEITKNDPVGHLNALFLNDIDNLEKDDYKEVFKAAKEQDAFIFWNHPGWERPECEWSSAQTEIYNNGWMNGIEVVNTNTYYKNAHKWALEKNLTIFCNSDTHMPINNEYDFSAGEHRPVTLVFAKARNKSSIKEALLSGRTAAYYKNILIGKEEFLKPLFYSSVKITKDETILKNDNSIIIQIKNSSDISFELIPNDSAGVYNLPDSFILPAHQTVMLGVSKKGEIKSCENIFQIPFRVKNLLIEPDKGLPIEIRVKSYSFENISLLPVPSNNGNSFRINLYDLPKEMQIFYTLDGKEPNTNSADHNKVFTVKDSLILKTVIYKNGIQFSEVMERDVFIHKSIGKSIVMKNKFTEKYSGGGVTGLVNGFTASTDFTDGVWQGYEQVDFGAIIDMRDEKDFKKIRINFLQDINSWIFPPKEIEVFTSIDGIKFSKILSEQFASPTNLSPRTIIKYEGDLSNKNFRYIMINANNTGLCPVWHKGAGGKAWLFIDEIIIQ